MNRLGVALAGLVFLAQAVPPLRAGQALKESFPGGLPATFAGDLPCADCPGIRLSVELHADHVFVRRMTYQGRGEGGRGESFDRLGRWNLSGDGKTLELSGDREGPMRFAVGPDGTLRKLDEAGQPIQSAYSSDLVRVPDAEPLEPRLLLRGEYSYMADAGMFVECLTGWRLPIAMEADNVALERGYLSAAPKPGEAVLVTLVGQIVMRPPMEGKGLRRRLVPLRFVSASARETCDTAGEARQAAPIDGTAWQLSAASLSAEPPEDIAGVTLKFKEGQVSVASGCNTGIGSYSAEGDTLTVGLLATTRKACPGRLAAWEPAFFAFLGKNPAIERTGDELVLTSGAEVLRFHALPVPSAQAVTRFVYVAAERRPCPGDASRECLQVRDQPTDPWRLHEEEIIGFTHEPGIEYRLRILEDEIPNAPADGPSKRWFLDLVVEQRVAGR